MTMENRISEVCERRAAFQPSTLNRDARTIELTWSTGSRVKRSTWFDGDYIEELSMDSAAIRLERLNGGASLLNNHQSRDLLNILGVVERAWVEGGEGRAVVRFSSRADVQPIFEDVASGVIRNVSVGYMVHTYEESGAPEGELRTFRAVDWEPMELSLVGIPADAGAQTRRQTQTLDHPPMTVATKTGDDPVTITIPAESVRTEAPAPASAEGAEDLKRSAAQLRRENDILRTCTIAKFDQAATEEFICSDLTSEQVARAVVERLAAAEPAKAAGSPARVQVTRDQGDTLMRGIGEYLHWRTRSHQAPTDLARDFRGMTLRELGRQYLDSRGVNTRGMGTNELVERAFHSTSDFPLLFAAVANKNLLAGYDEEPQTWRPLARQQNLPDFKLSRDLQIQGRIVPQVLGEGGEYQLATLTEAQATWSLVTYARKLLISRNAIINDDLGALETAPEVLGRGFRLHESDLVWDLITNGADGRPAGIDNVALFDAAHNNRGTGVINVANVTAGDLAMGLQQDVALNDLNLEPVYMLVPRALKVLAMQFLDTTKHYPSTKTGAEAVNPFAGNLELIVENRLQRDSAAQWYLAASPNRVPMIKFGYLVGEEGPTVTPIDKRDPDGIELLARYDFGCTVSDFRGFYRSTGA